MAVRERLIFWVSTKVSPSAPDSATLSLPARSTKCILPNLSSDDALCKSAIPVTLILRPDPKAYPPCWLSALTGDDEVGFVRGERPIPPGCDPVGTLLSTCKVRMA